MHLTEVASAQSAVIQGLNASFSRFLHLPDKCPNRKSTWKQLLTYINKSHKAEKISPQIAKTN